MDTGPIPGAVDVSVLAISFNALSNGQITRHELVRLAHSELRTSFVIRLADNGSTDDSYSGGSRGHRITS
jgi:hypothetical protein